MKQSGPIPKTIELANTLAQRVIQLREFRNMTVRDLARGTRFGIRRIEDIQSGLETWLSSTDRQILAKALTVEPAIIEEVEVRDYVLTSGQMATVPEVVMADLHKAILQSVGVSGKPERHNLYAIGPLCPLCGNELNCSIQHGFDMDGNPVQSAKAHCTKCTFLLR